MKKQYFAWKDGKNATDGTQEWEELTAKEFCELGIKIRTGQIEPKRYFACVPPAEKNDVYFYFECTYEQFLVSERKRIERLRKKIEEQELREQGLWYDLVSLDYEITDENGEGVSLYDMLADPDSLFEDSLIESLTLKKALSYLTVEERIVINALYLNDTVCTEREYTNEIGVSKTALHYRKSKVLNKIRKYLDQN